MANVVGVLWHMQSRDPLITPARIPLSHERIRTSVLYPLNPAFASVVDREVDGEGALPARMEVNPTRRISQSRAATRAARAVFLCSAPLVGQPNAGLNGQGLRLACAEPGDQLAIFGEALRELTERATYLYEEAGRYWFSTQPTLNRVADERAKALPEHELDADIIQTLQSDAGSKGGFHRVYAAPDDPVTIDEAQSLSLVILGPNTPHAGKGVGQTLAVDAAAETLTRCRASQRRFRNTLVFVAPDESQLAAAREVTRRAMAWASILKDAQLRKEMTQGQTDDAAEKTKTNTEGCEEGGSQYMEPHFLPGSQRHRRETLRSGTQPDLDARPGGDSGGGLRQGKGRWRVAGTPGSRTTVDRAEANLARRPVACASCRDCRLVQVVRLFAEASGSSCVGSSDSRCCCEAGS